MTSHDCGSYPDLYPPPVLPDIQATTDPECGQWPIIPDSIVQLIRARQLDLAEAALARWAVESAGPADASTRLQSLLLTAHIRLSAGQCEAGLDDLRRALALGRETCQFSGVLFQVPDILASLCAKALEAAIEPCYVKCLIKQASLDPPSPNVSDWPYPVCIYTLGQSAVVVNGQTLRFSGKAQRRPLLLLHCLLTRGGRAVPVALLRKTMGEENEDGDGHYTRGAFDMALSRLRHLLAVPNLLHLGDGLLSLNEEVCWVDAWACERLLDQVSRQPDPARGRALLERALKFYQGDFLEGEESGWAVLARERIRSRLLRVARRLGQSLEQSGRWAEAGQLYEFLREFFPVDEEICLHLIRSHIKRDEFAQATSIYTRCRELLAKVLGVLPSPALKALFEPVQLQP